MNEMEKLYKETQLPKSRQIYIDNEGRIWVTDELGRWLYEIVKK